MEFSLTLAQSRARFEPLTVLSSLPDFANAGGKITAAGMEITVRRIAALRAAIICADFGFLPETEISFRFENVEDRQEAISNLVTAVDAVLRRSEGDALLLSLAGRVVLQRRAGALSLCPDGFFWSPQRLAIIQRPRNVADSVLELR